MKQAIAAYKRMPARNKKIVKGYLFFLALMFVVAFMVFYPAEHETTTDGVDTAGKARVRGAGGGEGRLGDGQITEEYRRNKVMAERIRKAEARKKRDSYIPSVRDTLDGAATGEEDFLLEDDATDGSGGRGGTGAPAPTRREDVVTTIPEDKRCDPAGLGEEGMLLPDGTCIMPNGDIYDKDGNLITRNGEPMGPGSGGAGQGGATRSAANGRPSYYDGKSPDEIAKLRNQHLTDFLALLDRVDKTEESRAKVKLPKLPKPASEKKAADSTSKTDGQADKKAERKAFRGFLPGDMLIGLLDTKIDSDITKEIRVVIPTGAMRGAKLMGEIGKATDTGYVAAKLNYITYKGKHAKISAVLVDPTTRITALEGDVDRHLLLRLGTAFVYGIAVSAKDLILQKGSTTITSGSTTVARPAPTTKEILQAGAGRAAEIATDPLKKIIGRKPTITIPKNTIVGILFIEPNEINWLSDYAIREAARQ